MSGPPRASFRPLAAGDLPTLTRWLNQPHVARWWDERPDLASVRAEYGPRINGSEAVHCAIVSWDGQPCGMFQHYTWDQDPALAATLGAAPTDAGIDYLIGEVELFGRGLGVQMLTAFLAQEVLVDPGVAQVRVDVNADNVRSPRTLEKLGFALDRTRNFVENDRRYVVYRHGR